MTDRAKLQDRLHALRALSDPARNSNEHERLAAGLKADALEAELRALPDGAEPSPEMIRIYISGFGEVRINIDVTMAEWEWCIIMLNTPQ